MTVILFNKLFILEPDPPTAYPTQSTHTVSYKVSVTYIQASNHYQRGLQSALRQYAANKTVVNMELPIVLTDTQAVRLAEIQLNLLWSGRETFSAWVNYQYLFLSPGDVVRLRVDGINFMVRLTAVESGAPGLVHLQGVRELKSDYSSTARAGII